MPSKPSRQPMCRECPASVGPRSTLFCDYHAGYHAGHSVALMRNKRLRNPQFREMERATVQKRMRALRAARKSAQIEVTG